MKRLITALLGTVLLGLGMAGCDLLDPTNTENPDVLERDFLDFPDAMNSWLTGLERQTAIAMDNLIVPAEIASSLATSCRYRPTASRRVSPGPAGRGTGGR